MADFPLYGGYEEVDTDVWSTSDHTRPNTTTVNGSWVEVIASLSDDVDRVEIVMDVLTTGYTIQDIDIGIGGAGSEEVIINGIQVDGKIRQHNWLLTYDIRIPSGTRVAIRANNSGTGGIAWAMRFYRKLGFTQSESHAEAINDLSAGVAVDPGAVAFTKGSWTEIVASTAEDMNGFHVLPGGSGNTGQANITFLADVGIGSAGNEVVIHSDQKFISTSSEQQQEPWHVPVFVPAGTRIAIRTQASIVSDVADRIMDFSVIGIK